LERSDPARQVHVQDQEAETLKCRRQALNKPRTPSGTMLSRLSAEARIQEPRVWPCEAKTRFDQLLTDPKPD
jgi:hypothetical protein